MSDDLRYLYYNGKDLGSTPTTNLADGVRHVDWNLGDKRVRPLPADDAAYTLQHHPESFVETLTAERAAIKWSIKAERMAELAAKGVVHGETYTTKEGEAVPMVVLDDATTDGIAKERKTQAKAAKAKE